MHVAAVCTAQVASVLVANFCTFTSDTGAQLKALLLYISSKLPLWQTCMLYISICITFKMFAPASLGLASTMGEETLEGGRIQVYAISRMIRQSYANNVACNSLSSMLYAAAYAFLVYTGSSWLSQQPSLVATEIPVMQGHRDGSCLCNTHDDDRDH